MHPQKLHLKNFVDAKITTQRDFVTKQHANPNDIARCFAMLQQSLVRGGGDQDNEQCSDCGLGSVADASDQCRAA